MNLTKQRQKDKKARDVIFKALQEFHAHDPGIPDFTERRLSVDEYPALLTRKGIDAGVLSLVLLNNMAGGSSSDVDLYSLLHRYLLDRNIRKLINDIIQVRYG